MGPEPQDASARSSDLTRRLCDVVQGRADAVHELMPFVYAELKRIAENCFRSQAARHTLQPTALVNEAYLKLFDGQMVPVTSRAHFYALAARVMRQLLVDHARTKGREKRGCSGREPVTLGEALAKAAEIDVDVLDFEAALTELSEIDPRQTQVVEMRFFAGLEVEEVAETLGISISSVERDWRAARAWLGRRLKEAHLD